MHYCDNAYNDPYNHDMAYVATYISSVSKHLIYDLCFNPTVFSGYRLVHMLLQTTSYYSVMKFVRPACKQFLQM